MKQQSVLITGAASGIGRETALLFASKGWYVGAFDLDQAGLESLRAEIGPTNCHADVVDVTGPASVKAGMERFAAVTGGTMDLLVNNAGIIKFGLFEKVDLETHHGIIDVNLKGCLTCSYHALEYLKRTPGSRIINMSSASSLYGTPDIAVYSATKHAVSALTEALNIELERHGIFVCDIRPPYVRTPLLDVPEEVFSIKALGVRMEPSHVARTVWKAAHRKKLHWNIGTTLPLVIAFWLLPFARRLLVKTLTMPKQ